MSPSLTKSVLIAGALLALIVLPLLSGQAQVSLYNQIGIAIVFALAYNLLLGQSGLLSFGHAVYFGLGGFFTVQSMLWVNQGVFSWPTPLMPLIGGVAGLVSGYILGFFSTRRHGTAFAMISLAIAELMVAAALMLSSLSGGEEGISAWRAPWMGIQFGTFTEVYYLILFWVVVCVILLYGLTRTPFGRMMLAVRDNGERAQFIGFNTYWVRHMVFTVSATFAGIAGGLLAVNTELVNYETMGLLDSASVLINVFIGGMGFFAGPILGAMLLTTMKMFMSNYTQAWLAYQGIIFIVIVMFAQGGLAGIVYAHWPAVRGGHSRPLLRAYGKSCLPVSVLVLAVIFMIEFIFHWSEQQYSADAVPLFGVEWQPTGALPWAVIVIGLILGGFGLRYAKAAVRKGWDQVSEALKGGA